MSERKRTVHHFAGFSFDTGGGLSRGGEEVALRARSLELLAMLVDNAGRVVTKDELLGGVWSGQTVSEDSLTQCVHEVRRALGDTEQKLIRTVPKRGYTFAKEALDPAPVIEQPAVARPMIGRRSRCCHSSISAMTPSNNISSMAWRRT